MLSGRREEAVGDGEVGEGVDKLKVHSCKGMWKLVFRIRTSSRGHLLVIENNFAVLFPFLLFADVW